MLPPAVLVMCDVLNPDGSPHETNTRARLVELLTPDVVAERPLYGFEQARQIKLCGRPRSACSHGRFTLTGNVQLVPHRWVLRIAVG